MPPNNNLRSVITQCRNFSTRSRGGRYSPSRSINNASDGGSLFKDFTSSMAYGFLAFGIWATIESLEYRRTIITDLERRGCVAPSLLDDLRKWLLRPSPLQNLY